MLNAKVSQISVIPVIVMLSRRVAKLFRKIVPMMILVLQIPALLSMAAKILTISCVTTILTVLQMNAYRAKAVNSPQFKMPVLPPQINVKILSVTSTKKAVEKNLKTAIQTTIPVSSLRV